MIRRQTTCIVIAFLAPRKVRMDRIISRGRADDSPDAFEERDLREIAYGTAIPIALADEYVLNTATMEDFLNDIGRTISTYSLYIRPPD